MPSIPSRILDAVFFIYPGEEEARLGKRQGGTGFIVGYPVDGRPSHYLYLTTAAHIIRAKESLCVRMMLKNGEPYFLSAKQEDWWFSDDSDIAITRLQWTSGIDQLQFQFVHIGLFMRDEWIDDFRVGIGDDVFMVGRFTPYDGEQVNVPTVRYGHVSMMPERRVPMGKYGDIEAYLVDMGNRVGFSGSPVFISGSPGRLIWPADSSLPPQPDSRAFMWLFGLCSGVFPDETPVFRRNENGEESKSDFFSKGYTGMAIITPVHKITEMLESKQLVEDRKRENERMTELLKREGDDSKKMQIPFRFNF